MTQNWTTFSNFETCDEKIICRFAWAFPKLNWKKICRYGFEAITFRDCQSKMDGEQIRHSGSRWRRLRNSSTLQKVSTPASELLRNCSLYISDPLKKMLFWRKKLLNFFIYVFLHQSINSITQTSTSRKKFFFDCLLLIGYCSWEENTKKQHFCEQNFNV